MARECPKCGLVNPPDTRRCDCGYDFETRQGGAVHLDFGGTAIQLLGWILLSIVAALPIVPLAWVQAALARWICRNVRFNEGTTATFRGTGSQVVGWYILQVLVIVGFQIATRRIARERVGVTLLLVAIYMGAISGIVLKLISRFVSNVELSSASPLSFSGTYAGLLGWNMLVLISVDAVF